MNLCDHGDIFLSVHYYYAWISKDFIGAKKEDESKKMTYEQLNSLRYGKEDKPKMFTKFELFPNLALTIGI
mgnify:CR=1 FL=1